MAQKVRDVMTADPRTVSKGDTVAQAARVMKEADIGPVIVLDDGGSTLGIVTDRDIVVRAIAEGRDPNSTPVEQVASTDLTTVSPDDDAEMAAQMMREKAIRRVPVVEQGKPVGILAIGDLAVEKDPRSALADISAAPPNE